MNTTIANLKVGERGVIEDFDFENILRVKKYLYFQPWTESEAVTDAYQTFNKGN